MMVDKVSASEFFRLGVPEEVLGLVADTKVKVTDKQVREAWSRGPLAHLGVLTMDNHFYVAPRSTWEACLPHMGTERLKYVVDSWVCRQYSGLFSVVAAGVLGLDGTALVLDFKGGHAYNALGVCGEKGSGSGGGGVGLEVLMVEPQTDRVVDKLDPKQHYVGETGLGLWG